MIGGTVFQLLGSAIDRDVLQVCRRFFLTDVYSSILSGKAAALCLTKMIRYRMREVLAWVNSQGNSGLQETLGVISRLLDPAAGEVGGLVVGDLIIHVLLGAGSEILGILPTLLQAMISRMMEAKTGTLLQVRSAFTSSIHLFLHLPEPPPAFRLTYPDPEGSNP